MKIRSSDLILLLEKLPYDYDIESTEEDFYLINNENFREFSEETRNEIFNKLISLNLLNWKFENTECGIDVILNNTYAYTILTLNDYDTFMENLSIIT